MGSNSSKPELKFNVTINSIYEYCKRINKYEILDEPLRNFYIKSSHNSYIGGNAQILAKSSTNNTRNAILKYGARCIELDLMPSANTINFIDFSNPSEPMVSHSGWDSGVSRFEDHCKMIKDVAFSNTDDPFIIYLEINKMNNNEYTRLINYYIKTHLGGMLYEHTFVKTDFDTYFPNVPIKKLLGKICIVMNYYLSDLKSNEKPQAFKNRSDFLFPVVHGTTNEPDGGWFNGKGYMLKGQSSNDTSNATFSKMERVYPYNTLFSSNFSPEQWYNKGYSIISMNVQRNDSYMSYYNYLFSIGSIHPKNWYVDRNKNVEKALWFNFGSARNAIWFKNIQYISNHSIKIYHDIAYSDGCSWLIKDNELTIQSDGNLVYYKKKKLIWSSETKGNIGAILIMQSDGNLVIYTTDMKAIWSSETSNKITTHAEFLADGSFGIMNKDEFVKKIN